MRARSVAIGAAAIVLLSGCSALPSGFASPSPSGSASPSASAGPIGPAFGDVAPRESITDEHGTYLHVTLAPSSDAATRVDDSVLGASIEGSSWDDDALLEAQRFVATFVAEQTIDSSALDRDLEGWQQWVAANGEKFFGPTMPNELSKPDNGSDRPTPIFNDPDDFTPRLVRDGLARLDDATIVIDDIDNEPREGGEWLRISGTSEVAYRLADVAARDALLQQGFDQETIDSYPELADGQDGHYLTHLEWSYSVERVGDGWIIHDYDLVWDSIIEGVSQA